MTKRVPKGELPPWASPAGDAPDPRDNTNGTAIFRQTWAVFRKELLVEWRMRSRVSGIFWFALALTLMVAFANPATHVLREIGGGTLWIAILLASTRSLDQSYAVEHENGAMEGLQLWPVDPVAIFYGKALANTLILLLVCLSILPAIFALFEPATSGDPLQLIAVIVLGCAAIAAPGTVFGLITSQARGSSVLLPLLLFPLVVPALLAASSATTRLFEGDPMDQAPAWIGVLVVFDLVHWAISPMLYGRIFDE